MSTNVSQFFSELGAGVFEEKLSRVLSDVAGAVVDLGRAGEVNIKLQVKQIGSTHQVTVNHKLSYTMPTMRGKASEEDTTQTPMHVGTGGAMSLFPENQTALFDKRGRVNEDTNHG